MILQDTFGIDKTAKLISEKTSEYTGVDGITAWHHWVGVIHDNPTITRSEAKAEWVTWADANHNLVYFDTSVDSLIRNFVPAGTWDGLVALIVSKPVQRWVDFIVLVTDERASWLDQYTLQVTGVVDGVPMTATQHYNWVEEQNPDYPQFRRKILVPSPWEFA